MSKLRDVEDELRAQWSSLQAHWHTTRRTWRDGVAERFEREFWHDCEQTMQQYLKRLDEMGNTFEQTERHLE